MHDFPGSTFWPSRERNTPPCEYFSLEERKKPESRPAAVCSESKIPPEPSGKTTADDEADSDSGLKEAVLKILADNRQKFRDRSTKRPCPERPGAPAKSPIGRSRARSLPAFGHRGTLPKRAPHAPVMRRHQSSSGGAGVSPPETAKHRTLSRFLCLTHPPTACTSRSPFRPGRHTALKPREPAGRGKG